MKRLHHVLAFLGVFISTCVFSQSGYLDRDSVQGACDPTKIYRLEVNSSKYKRAECLVGDSEILARINSTKELRAQTSLKAKFEILIIISCQGVILETEILKSTKGPEIDQSIRAVFHKHNKWSPGEAEGNKVDSFVVKKIRIKKGIAAWI